MTRTKKTANKVSETNSALPTFADHIQELRSRLFFVALAFVVAAGLAYPFFEHIMNFLIRPLGGTELYYLTPGGGLTFIIKVCMYVGFIGMLPVAVYQLYRFISPIMKRDNTRAVLLYTTASTVLALAGVLFAYFVSLPAALHFLTNIELLDIKPMLTIDSYMSFIGAYLLAGALLFQLPLILLLINSVTPTPPRKLMAAQKFIIVGAFVFAAVISPTPDVINQSILAVPIIITYQIGILAVWLRQRQQRRTGHRQRVVIDQEPEPIQFDTSDVSEGILQQAYEPNVHPVVTAAPQTQPPRHNIDGIIRGRGAVSYTSRRVEPAAPRSAANTGPSEQSIDGFFAPVSN